MSRPSVNADGSAPRVLVADGHHDAADALVLLLRACGYDARAVYGVSEALHRATVWVPDAVVCDVALPGPDGYTLARRLRQGPGPPALLALTALTAEGAAAQAAGFDCHLLKTVAPGELLRALAAALAARSTGFGPGPP